VLVSAVEAKKPDLTGIFERLSADMWAFLSKYDAQEQAVIQDYIENTIRVMNQQIARLAQES